MATSPSTALDVRPELCLVRPDVRDRETLLRLIARSAAEQGYVAATFEDALVERERVFPTGLPTPVPVAIPHTDSVHVLRPGLAAALLAEPIPFGEMGTDDRTVDCALVVVLLVTDPADQVGVLGALITAFQQEGWSQSVADVRTPAELAQALTGLLSDGQVP